MVGKKHFGILQQEPERARAVIERPPPPPPPPDSPVLTQSTQISTQTQRDDPVMILKSLTMLSDLVRILFRTNFFLPPLETQSSSVIVIVGSNRERDRDNRD